VKHLAIIQSEFLKEAQNWDELSLQQQREYLRQHPASERRLTAKPSQEDKSEKSSSTDQTARAFASMGKYDLEHSLKGNLLSAQKQLRGVMKTLSDNDTDWDTYNKALINISTALLHKKNKNMRHQPTGGPGVMPVWFGGKRVR
jgi:hypothetical protein